MSATRRWHRAASAWVLIAAGSHLVGHWRAFVAVDASDPLFEPHRVPGDVVVDKPIAEFVVESFAANL